MRIIVRRRDVKIVFNYLGESPNEYLFTRQKLNWEGEQYTFLSSYSSGVSFIGTTIIVFFLSKVFECSDPFMGIVGTTLSGIARIFYVSSLLL